MFIMRKENRSKLFLILGILLAAIIGYFLWPIIAPFFFAILLAYILRPLANLLLKKKVPALASILIIYVSIFGFLAVLIYFCLPGLAEQSQLLLQYIPKLIDRFTDKWLELLTTIKRVSLPESIFTAINNAADTIEIKIAQKFELLALQIPQIIKIGLYILLAPILSYYFLRDKSLIKKKLISYISPRNRPEILRLAGDVDNLLRQFICGYLLVSIIIAVITGIFLSIIGVDYAFVLGIIMGIADLIPYFGPIVGSIPPILIAFAESNSLAIITIIGLFLIQQLEGFVITPIIIGDRIGMHPLTTIFVVMAGGYLFGILGAILAVPAAASVFLIWKYAYSHIVSYQENL